MKTDKSEYSSGSNNGFFRSLFNESLNMNKAIIAENISLSDIAVLPLALSDNRIAIVNGKKINVCDQTGQKLATLNDTNPIKACFQISSDYLASYNSVHELCIWILSDYSCCYGPHKLFAGYKKNMVFSQMMLRKYEESDYKNEKNISIVAVYEESKTKNLSIDILELSLLPNGIRSQEKTFEEMGPIKDYLAYNNTFILVRPNEVLDEVDYSKVKYGLNPVYVPSQQYTSKIISLCILEGFFPVLVVSTEDRMINIRSIGKPNESISIDAGSSPIKLVQALTQYMFASVHKDNSIKIWDSIGVQIAELAQSQENTVDKLFYLPDEKKLACLNKMSGNVTIWNIATLKCEAEYQWDALHIIPGNSGFIVLTNDNKLMHYHYEKLNDLSKEDPHKNITSFNQ